MQSVPIPVIPKDFSYTTMTFKEPTASERAASDEINRTLQEKVNKILASEPDLLAEFVVMTPEAVSDEKREKIRKWVLESPSTVFLEKARVR